MYTCFNLNYYSYCLHSYQKTTEKCIHDFKKKEEILKFSQDLMKHMIKSVIQYRCRSLYNKNAIKRSHGKNTKTYSKTGEENLFPN